MIALYIIAGAILGFFSTGFIGMFKGMNDTTPLLAQFLLAFVGGVAGHLLFNLVYNT